MKKLPAMLAAMALFGGGSLPVVAQATAHGALSFVQPDGTAGPNDTINVFLRLTLDADSETLSVDESGVITAGGPSLTEIADAGIDVSQPYGVGFSQYVACGGTLFSSGHCDGNKYLLGFAAGPVNFTLNGGQSVDFLALYFTPDPGPVPAGVYNFYEAGLTIAAYGLNANGDYIFPGFASFATCTQGDDRCDFSRTVTGAGSGAPEPSAWALLIDGFGLAGAALRRRRTALAARAA